MTQVKRENPPFEACLFYTEENVPENQQYNLACPQQGHPNNTLDMMKEYLQITYTASLLKIYRKLYI